jgi:hypothetical protein
MRRLFSSAVVVPLALIAGACGSTNDTPTPGGPTGPTQANVVVTASSPQITLSPRSGFTYRITIPVTIRETAGLGANIDSMRLQLMASGRSVETQEIGSGDVIAVTGSNRLQAGATRTFTLYFDVNAGQATSGLLTLSFTDDRGNRLTADFTIAFS